MVDDDNYFGSIPPEPHDEEVLFGDLEEPICWPEWSWMNRNLDRERAMPIWMQLFLQLAPKGTLKEFMEEIADGYVVYMVCDGPYIGSWRPDTYEYDGVVQPLVFPVAEHRGSFWASLSFLRPNRYLLREIDSSYHHRLDEWAKDSPEEFQEYFVEAEMTIRAIIKRERGTIWQGSSWRHKAWIKVTLFWLVFG